MKPICLIAAAALLLCSGCATSVCRHRKAESGRVSSSGKKVVADIRGYNYGYFLFYGIPLWSGPAHRPNEEEWDLWKNQVRDRDLRRMFARRAEQLKADEIDDVKISQKSSGFWSLWIIWRRSVTGTCVAVKEPEKNSVKTEKKSMEKKKAEFFL